MLIDQKMTDGLNRQIGLEYGASMQYLAMAAWFEEQGLAGFAKFFLKQSAEENEHGLKIVRYLGEVDGKVVIPALAKPKAEWKNVETVLEQFVAMEEDVTRAIYALVELAHAEHDHSAVEFLQWYVSEQREEVSSARSLLDQARLMGEGRIPLLDAHLRKG